MYSVHDLHININNNTTKHNNPYVPTP